MYQVSVTLTVCITMTKNIHHKKHMHGGIMCVRQCNVISIKCGV